jgi:hypothetical protein
VSYPRLPQPGTFRITFRTEGKRRTVWAKKLRENTAKGVVIWSRLEKDGDEPEPMEIIITTTDEVVARPVVMNLHYAEFEVAKA